MKQKYSLENICAAVVLLAFAILIGGGLCLAIYLWFYPNEVYYNGEWWSKVIVGTWAALVAIVFVVMYTAETIIPWIRARTAPPPLPKPVGKRGYGGKPK
jgi:hypothetical protein